MSYHSLKRVKKGLMGTQGRTMQKTRGLLTESTILEQQIADLHLQGLTPAEIEKTVNAHKDTIAKALKRIDKEIEKFSPGNAKSLVVSKFLQFTISHGVINKALAIELTKLDHDIGILYALTEEQSKLTLSIDPHHGDVCSNVSLVKERLAVIGLRLEATTGTHKARESIHKQIIANNKSYADIMHKMGVSALASPTISNGSHPSPENNNKISSANQDEIDVASELRAAADRIDKHLKGGK